MATRDYEHFTYWTIAVEKDSETHKAILADANARHTKQIPTVLSLRIEEYYALKKAGLLYTGPGNQGEVITKEGTIHHKTNIQFEIIDEKKVLANLEAADDLFN
jgi:hypothetical protein